MRHTRNIGAQWVCVVIGISGCLLAQRTAGQVTVTISPSDDAFVRAAAPTINYGSAGALAVAGPNAMNASTPPQSQGRFDTVMKFNTAAAVTNFNNTFGVGHWSVTGVRLNVFEDSAPANPIFNVGAGQFQVSWLSQDAWVEGSGSPQNPVTGTGTQITWNLLQTLVGSGMESGLGTYANTLTTSPHSYDLSLTASLLADIGGAVTLHLSPVSSTIGYTFNARNFISPSVRPTLMVTAVPEPGTVMLLGAGACLLRRRRRVEADGT